MCRIHVFKVIETTFETVCFGNVSYRRHFCNVLSKKRFSYVVYQRTKQYVSVTYPRRRYRNVGINAVTVTYIDVREPASASQPSSAIRARIRFRNVLRAGHMALALKQEQNRTLLYEH